MIQPLTKIIISDGSIDGIQTSRIPSNVDMMDKINELVHAYNRLEKSVGSIDSEIRFNKIVGNLKSKGW